VTGSKLTLTWTGAINNIWDYSSTYWTEGSGNTFFASGDNGIIETPAAITIRPEGVVADAITVRNTSGTASFGGGALSAASLAKSNDGDLELGVAAVVTSLTLNNGSLAIVGSGSLTATTVMNNASLAYATSGTQTLAAEISGTGSISSAGGGTLSLTGTSTFTGSLASAAGSTVQIAGGGIRLVAPDADGETVAAAIDTFAASEPRRDPVDLEALWQVAATAHRDLYAEVAARPRRRLLFGRRP
jgi:hypothetical protein